MIMWPEGQWEASKKTAPDGSKPHMDGHGKTMTKLAQWGRFSENAQKKNPAYGRHQLSRCMRIVEPMLIQSNKKLVEKPHPRCFNSMFERPQSFNDWTAAAPSFNDWTARSFNSMVEALQPLTNERPRKKLHPMAQTHIRTWRLLDQLGPRGRVGENGLRNSIGIRQRLWTI